MTRASGQTAQNSLLIRLDLFSRQRSSLQNEINACLSEAQAENRSSRAPYYVEESRCDGIGSDFRGPPAESVGGGTRSMRAGIACFRLAGKEVQARAVTAGDRVMRPGGTSGRAKVRQFRPSEEGNGRTAWPDLPGAKALAARWPLVGR